MDEAWKKKDIQLIKIFNNWISNNPKINEFFDEMVSKNPLKDINLILLVVFVMGIYEYQSQYFWMTMINLILSYGLMII